LSTLAVFDVIIRGDTSGLRKSLNDGQAQVQGFFGSVRRLTAAFLGARAIESAIQGIARTATQAIMGTNEQLESATYRFATLFGDFEKAKALVGELALVAAETPLSFLEVVKGAQYLLQFGGAALNTKANLILLQDTAVATGANFERISFWVARAYAALQAGQPFGRARLSLMQLGVILPQTAAKIEHLQKTGANWRELWDLMVKDMLRFQGAGLRQINTWKGLSVAVADFFDLAVAQAFEPLFQAAKRLFGTILGILRSGDTQSALGQFADGLGKVLAVAELVAGGLGEVFRGFIAGAQNLAGIIVNTVGGAWDGLMQFGADLYSGGLAAIQSYAQGILDGAVMYVQEAISYVISFIAGFLIGQSPPPKGPLSQIYKGGRNTIEAWVEGALSADLTPVERIPKVIAGTVKQLEAALAYADRRIRSLDDSIFALDLTIAKFEKRIESVREEFTDKMKPAQDRIKAIDREINVLRHSSEQLERQVRDINEAFEADVKPFQDAIEGINDQIEGLDRASRSIDKQMRAIEKSASAVKKQYDAQLNSMEKQLKAVRNVLSTQDKLKTNSLRLQRNELEIAFIRAEGNEALQEQLQAQMDSLDNVIRLNDLENENKELRAEMVAIPLEEQLEAMQDAAEGIMEPFDAALDVLKGQQDAIAENREGLEDQIGAYEDLIAKAEEARDKLLAPLEAQIDTIARQIEVLEDERYAQEQIVQTLQDEMDALITPLEDQLKIYQDQRAELEEQRKIWTEIRSRIQDAYSVAKEAEEKAKAGKKGAGAPDFGPDPFRPDPAITKATVDAAEKAAKAAHEAALAAAKDFVDSFTGFLRDNLPTVVGAVFGFLTGGFAGAGLGAVIGAALQNTIFGSIEFDMEAVSGQLGSAIGAVLGFFVAGPLGAIVGATFGNLGGQLLEQIFGTLTAPGAAESLGGQASGIVDGIVVMLQGAIDGAILWLQNEGLPMLGNLVTALITGIQQFFQSIDYQGLLLGFLDLLSRLLIAAGNWTLNEGIPLLATIVTNLVGGIALLISSIDWAEVVNLFGAFLDRMITWITDVAIPKLGEYAQELGNALGKIDWEAVLTQFGQFLVSVGMWVVNDVIPEFIRVGQDVGGKLLTGMGDLILGSDGLIAKFLGWIASVDWGKVFTTIVEKGGEVAENLLTGLVDFFIAEDTGIIPQLVNAITSIEWGDVYDSILKIGNEVALSLIGGFGDFLFGKNGSKGLFATLFGVIFDPGGLQDQIFGILGKIGQIGIDMATSLGKGFANTLVEIIEGAVNAMIDGINGLQIHFNGLETPFGKLAEFHWNGLGIGRIKLPRFHEGGYVPGMRNAEVPILARAGELVLTEAQQKGLGGALIENFHYHAGPGESKLDRMRNARELTEAIEEHLYNRGYPLKPHRPGTVAGTG